MCQNILILLLRNASTNIFIHVVDFCKINVNDLAVYMTIEYISSKLFSSYIVIEFVYPGLPNLAQNLLER